MKANAELLLAATVLDEQGIEFMTVWTPQGWKAPKGFPRRELLCCPSTGGRTSRVSVTRLLAYLRTISEAGQLPTET